MPGTRWIRTLLMLSAVLSGVTAAAQAQKTHEIQLEANREKDVYRFSPARVTAAPGDILVFTVVSGAPHSIVFEGKELPAAARIALSQALGGRQGELSSPMLAKNGKVYRLVVPKLANGNYPYFCLPHRAYDMRGEIVVKN